MKALIWFVLGIFYCMIQGNTKQAPNKEDAFEAAVNKRLKQKADSINQKTVIVYIDTIIPSAQQNLSAINRILDENKRLKAENKFYRQVANNPVIVYKYLPSETESDYAVKDSTVHKTKIGKIISKIF